jgi:glycosyltransferase involved in cell wall biosynthesis
MISKFATWWPSVYYDSLHPESVAIRKLVARNKNNFFILVGEGDRFNHFAINGVHFYNVAIHTFPKLIVSLFFKFQLSLMLRPSAIAAFGTINIIPLGISSIILRARFIPIIPSEISYAVEGLPSFVKKINQYVLSSIFKKSYRVLVLGSIVKKDLVQTYGVNSKKIILYKYKVSEIFKPQSHPLLRKTLNPSGGPIVMTICRISPEKGLDYLIEASKKIVKIYPNVKVIIKGFSGKQATAAESRYYKQLIKLIIKEQLQENVAIIEGSNHQEIPKYLSAADVFVLPSLSEGLPLVILEALATGVPIVATSVGGIPDVLTDGKNGLLVESRRADKLAEAINKLLDKEALRKLLVKNGLETIIMENDLEKYLNNLLLI